MADSLADDERTLAAHAATLGSAIDANLDAWVERVIVDRVPMLTPALRDEIGVVTGGVRSIVAGPLRDALEADVDDRRGSPLDALRSGIGPITALLERQGVPTPQRDEMDVRIFPDDHYGVAPANFADIDPSLQEPGIVWGAARAHVHLRRRREQDLET